ncbi:hypothetical protein ACHAXR_012996, partial [Thalassiosira sp. AJA248-18]
RKINKTSQDSFVVESHTTCHKSTRPPTAKQITKMKLSIVCTCLLFTLAATSAAEGEAHSCACEAEEFDFKINCADTSAMLDAMTFLKSNGCATNCSSPDCEKNYLIVQSHHDYCPEEVVPEEIEDGFHDYDEVCTACDIVRKNTEGAPDCPAPNCQDKSGDEAYGALVEAGCGTDCSSVACRDNYFVLRVAHDLCDHDTLSRASEEGLHDMEVSCAAQICNTAGGEDAQLVCEDHGK